MWKNQSKYNTILESGPMSNLYVHFSRVECNLSPNKLAKIALNQRNARTNSKVENVTSMVTITT